MKNKLANKINRNYDRFSKKTKKAEKKLSEFLKNNMDISNTLDDFSSREQIKSTYKETEYVKVKQGVLSSLIGFGLALSLPFVHTLFNTNKKSIATSSVMTNVETNNGMDAYVVAGLVGVAALAILGYSSYSIIKNKIKDRATIETFKKVKKYERLEHKLSFCRRTMQRYALKLGSYSRTF